MASFSLPHIPETQGLWGPPAIGGGPSTSGSGSGSSSLLPEAFHDIPFAPYSKSSAIGRIADWQGQAGGAGQGRDDPNGPNARGGRQGRRDQQAYGSGTSNAFAYFHGDDEATFSVVDNTKTTTSRRGGLTAMGRGGRGGRGGAAGGRGGFAGGRGGAVGGQRGGRMNQRGGASGMGARGGRRGGWRDWDKPQRTREPSITVGPEWEQLEEIDFSRLAKLRLEVPEGTEIASYGTLHAYDRTYDRIASVKFEKPLQPLDRIRYNPTTSDDPILSDIASKPATAAPAEEGEEPGKPPARLFITDSILALLMCATRTVYPWDLTISVTGNGDIFFDKRDGGAFDYVTVNENAADPPMEAENKDDGNKNASANINTPGNLSLEATYINQNFAFQVVDTKKTRDLSDGSNPFHDASQGGDADQLASAGYRYKKFDLSSSLDDPIELYVRTELDAYVPGATKTAAPQYITIRTLNEYDSRAQGSGGAPDWRTKLDAQRGAVVANEMKNNAGKLARWAVQSVLAGADNMKMGYISRATPKDSSRHSILGTQSYKPTEFAAQINVNFANGWGIVRTVADLARKSAAEGSDGEGKFVLAKDPNKATVRLYRVPLNGNEDEDEEDGIDIMSQVREDDDE